MTQVSSHTEYLRAWFFDHWKKCLFLAALILVLLAVVMLHRGYQQSKLDYAKLKKDSYPFVYVAIKELFRSDELKKVGLNPPSPEWIEPPIYLSLPDKLDFTARASRLDPREGGGTKLTEAHIRGSLDYSKNRLTFHCKIMAGIQDMDYDAEAFLIRKRDRRNQMWGMRYTRQGNTREIQYLCKLNVKKVNVKTSSLKRIKSDWPSGTGYNYATKSNASSRLDSDPKNISTCHTIITGVTKSGFVITGKVRIIENRIVLDLRPGAKITYQAKSPNVCKLKDIHGNTCRIKTGMTVQVDPFGEFRPVKE